MKAGLMYGAAMLLMPALPLGEGGGELAYILSSVFLSICLCTGDPNGLSPNGFVPFGEDVFD